MAYCREKTYEKIAARRGARVTTLLATAARRAFPPGVSNFPRAEKMFGDEGPLKIGQAQSRMRLPTVGLFVTSKALSSSGVPSWRAAAKPTCLFSGSYTV